MTTYLTMRRTVTKMIKTYQLHGTSTERPSLEFKGKVLEMGSTFLIGQPQTIVHEGQPVQIVPIIETVGKKKVMRETGDFVLLTELLEKQL